jgi:hypothetical protein
MLIPVMSQVSGLAALVSHRPVRPTTITNTPSIVTTVFNFHSPEFRVFQNKVQSIQNLTVEGTTLDTIVREKAAVECPETLNHCRLVLTVHSHFERDSIHEVTWVHCTSLPFNARPVPTRRYPTIRNTQHKRETIVWRRVKTLQLSKNLRLYRKATSRQPIAAR